MQRALPVWWVGAALAWAHNAQGVADVRGGMKAYGRVIASRPGQDGPRPRLARVRDAIGLKSYTGRKPPPAAPPVSNRGKSLTLQACPVAGMPTSSELARGRAIKSVVQTGPWIRWWLTASILGAQHPRPVIFAHNLESVWYCQFQAP